MAAVVTADIKLRIKKPAYDLLVGRDDLVCDRAIATAGVWIKSRLAKGGITSPDLTTDAAREAIILRTLSELYSYNGQADEASSHLSMAREIVDGMVGMSGTSGGSNGPVMVAVEGGVPTWLANY